MPKKGWLENMKRALPLLIVIVLLLATAPGLGSVKWRTHWNIAGAVYDAMPDDVRSNLNEDLIDGGAVAPDKWHSPPYYIGQSHHMTYAKEQGAYWLRRASDAYSAGDYDNASYYLGIASHFWGDVTLFSHHDNSRKYYEDRYGSELGYDEWDERNDHLNSQTYYYRWSDIEIELLKRGENWISGYSTLDDYLDNYVDPMLDSFIDNVITPGDPIPENGLWFYWTDGLGSVRSWSDPIGNVFIINVGFPRNCVPAKQSVDMSIILLYNGWMRAVGEAP